LDRSKARGSDLIRIFCTKSLSAMKKVYILSILVALFSFVHTGKAQYDPLYNQYSFDQLMINPAYTGVHDIFSVSLISRIQWVNIEGAPITNTFTANTSIGNNKAGIGAILINDRFGVSNNTELYLTYGYKINFGRGSLSAGIQGGYMSYKYDYSKLNLEFEDDPSFSAQDEQISQPNFGVGLWYQTDKYYIGLSMPRILEVEIDISGEPSNRYRRQFYISAGGMITLNPTLKLKPYGLIRIIDGAPANIDIGANLLFRELIWAGVLIRDLDALALMTQLEINDKFRVGVSVELATTKLVTTSYGTYEIMLVLDFAAFSQQVLKRRYF